MVPLTMQKRLVYPLLPQGADPFPLPLRVAKTGKNYLNGEITPSSPLG